MENKHYTFVFKCRTEDELNQEIYKTELFFSQFDVVYNMHTERRYDYDENGRFVPFYWCYFSLHKL